MSYIKCLDLCLGLLLATVLTCICYRVHSISGLDLWSWKLKAIALIALSVVS
jgi:hypothetical protein